MKRTDFRVICLIALCATLFGCGVDWFPDIRRAGTTPNAFSFNSRVGVPIAALYSSHSVVITGFANSSTASPISVSNGTVKVNGVTASTVKNNDSVKVFQTTGAGPRTQVDSVVTIGIIPATFSTVTQTIVTPQFNAQLTSPLAGFTEIRATITASDASPHSISMIGDRTQMAIIDSSGIDVLSFTTSTQTFTVPFLNNHRIRLLIPNPASTVPTTLTIDSTRFVITNTAPFAVTAAPI